MHSLERLTLDTITGEGLIRPETGTVIVGVSGGPDSVGLLHVLAALRGLLAVEPIAVYVDHGLRPHEVTEERRFVAGQSEKLRIAFESVRVEVQAFAKREKMSLEQAARELRYDALRAVASKYKGAPVAVAHTADDQAEEILVRLLRAGGRKALSGMRSRNNDVIRPFLSVWKSDIVRYLKENKIVFCYDSSNADMRFLRNRVRHRLLPYLERNFDRGVRRALCKTAETLAADEALLEELSDHCLVEVVVGWPGSLPERTPSLVLDRQKLLETPPALQRRVVEKLLWQVGGKAVYSHIVKIIAAAKSGRTGTEYHLSKGLRLGVQKQHLELVFPRGKGAWRGRLYDDKR